MKYCSKCGNQLFEEAVVCVKCGCSVGNANGYSNQKTSSNDGLGTAAKILSIITCVIFSFIALMWTFTVVGATSKANERQFEMLVPVIIFVVFMLILLVINISMTVKLCHKLNYVEPISIGFKICILLFVNMIAGILLLCMKNYE